MLILSLMQFCCCYLLLFRILCQCGMDVSAMDFDGWTPLHAAAHWGQGEACRILAEQLCNMEVRSNAVRPKKLAFFIGELNDVNPNYVFNMCFAFFPCCFFVK